MNKYILFCTLALAACGPTGSGLPDDYEPDQEAVDAGPDADTIDLGAPLLHAVSINGTLYPAVEFGRRPEATVVNYENRIAAAAAVQGCGRVWVPSVHVEGYAIQNAPGLPEIDPLTTTTLCYRHDRDTSTLTCADDLPTCIEHSIGHNDLFLIEFVKRLP